MKSERALEALRNGDLETAVPLLAQAAREAGYASDIINQAYTLALYRAGEKQRLSDIAFNLGNSLLPNDPAAAMDYFQRALLAGLDPRRVRRIGEIFEEWASSMAPPAVNVSLGRVAHVVGCLLPGHAPARYVNMLAGALKRRRIESTVFTTEWSASWFFNPAGVQQSQPMTIEADILIGSIEGDFERRAARVARAIRASGIQVVFYHSSLVEQITARVASLWPAPVQINVNHGSELDADLFSGFVHLFQNGRERTRFRSHPAAWIPLASDIEERLGAAPVVARRSMGLESASSVSATFGNLQEAFSSGYLKALSEILKRSPRHFHLFAGAGDVKAARLFLHAQGVLPRVRFLGQVTDVAPLFEAVDVYLAAFPAAGGHSVLDAMGAGRPVVVLKFSPDSPYNSGAELAGFPELTARNEGEYVEIAGRLIRSPSLRARCSEELKNRFQSEFRPVHLGERYVQFLNVLCGVGV